MIRQWLTHPEVRGYDVDDPRLVPVLRRVVRDKTFLRRIYDEWYDAILRDLPAGDGPILELGSGGGFFGDVLPGLITSELQPCDHVRIALDAQALPFAQASLRAIVMVNVLHHLPEVRHFLADAARCVRPGGRMVMVEPWVSPWSSLVYRRLHHEPFLTDAPEWEFPRGGPLSAANMALPWIAFVRDRARFEREFPEWRIRKLEPAMPFRYLLSGGVSMRSLMPGWTFTWWRIAEQALTPWRDQLGMFATIVIERTEQPQLQDAQAV